ncbi:hypothetical protein Tco_0748360 [Tanacetum coccineum]|uniref:Uncharacterized protein n=1 Tax=Tanacetum coccineum TaxID=301880 RepID=A0ABQ4YVF1_9ASTR
MQSIILKHQFRGILTVFQNRMGIHKGYERFQCSSQSARDFMEAGVSTEMQNPEISKILLSVGFTSFLNYRNKTGSTTSSSNLQNVAFVSEKTNSTNDVSITYGVSNTSGHISKNETKSSYSLLQVSQLDHEDLDLSCMTMILEEMGLKNGKWQMISMRIKSSTRRLGILQESAEQRNDTEGGRMGILEIKMESRTRKKDESSKSMVTVDGLKSVD